MNTTTGIVLQKIDYSETSLIVKVLTAEFGLKSFIYQGAKRSKKKGQLVSPLSVLNMMLQPRACSYLQTYQQYGHVFGFLGPSQF